MKFIFTMIFTAALAALCGGTAYAQKSYPKPEVVTTSTLPPAQTTPKRTPKTTTRTTTRRSTRTATRTNAKPAAGVAASSQKVSNQITNVTRFLYLLGGIAKGIEEIDKDSRANAQARSA